MIQVFKTDEDYKKWLNGQTLPSGIVVYVSDDETMYFSTNNIKGELKTYKCEKEEPIQYPPLIYSAKSAGSTITVNGETVTLEQGDNITLDYPNEITSVEATDNEELTYLQIPNTVTSINDNAFGGCVALSEITIPDSVKSIGVGAFQTCIGLTSINIPSGVTSISMETFNGCSALASVTLPDTLQTIGDSAFNDCSVLASITIPSSVTMIDGYAFCYCEALTDFNFNGTMEQWGAITLGTDWNLNAAFTVVHCTDGDVSLEEPIQPIQPNKLVYSAKSAGSTIKVNGQSVTLEQGENIVLDYPNEITSVKATDNTALTYIQTPNTMTMIGNWAFGNCPNLASINITEGVTSIIEGTFQSCPLLSNITLPNSLTSIGQSVFEDCVKLVSITIPEGVKSIGDYSFRNCEALSNITLPNSLTSISNNIFRECKSLKSITIPEGVKSIGNYSFSECVALSSITIPSTVTSIGNDSFNGSSTLNDFNFNGTMAQWKAITLGYGWKRGAAFKVIHCTDGDVTL